MTLFHADKARSAGSTPPPACQRKKNPLFQSISKSFNEILKYSYNCIGKLKGFCVSEITNKSFTEQNNILKKPKIIFFSSNNDRWKILLRMY